jgi:SAM-dependent methyltransferase
MRKFAPNLEDLDNSQTTDFHRSIILNKPFLKAIYEEWYALQNKYLVEGQGEILEIGSGGGFIKNHLEEVITSDIQELSYCDLCCDASALPFGDHKLKAILMINVFHHIPEPEAFLSEAVRTLKKGGRISGWQLREHGKPMSVANGALPWIIFKRDRARFDKQYPSLHIEKMGNFMPLKYIISGGFSRPSLLGMWAYSIMSLAEKILSPLNQIFGMFQLIIITKE